MLNRRNMLGSIASLPLFSAVKEEHKSLPDDEVKAKAEMWDLFMKVVQKAYDKVERAGQQVPIVNPSKNVGTGLMSIALGDEYFQSSNVEEIYIRGLVHRLEELSN